jgi:hypothetical protein
VPEFNWFFQLFEDQDDPHTPLFWETMNWASRQGMDLKVPDVHLSEPSIGVQVQELKRQVALKTPTQMMPTLE